MMDQVHPAPPRPTALRAMKIVVQLAHACHLGVVWHPGRLEAAVAAAMDDLRCGLRCGHGFLLLGPLSVIEH